MARQKVSLLDAMTLAVDDTPPRPAAPVVSVKKTAPHPQQPPAKPETAPSRLNKKHIGAYFDMATWQQWNILGIEQDGRTTQDMLEEAVNDFFIKHGKSSIA